MSGKYERRCLAASSSAEVCYLNHRGLWALKGKRHTSAHTASFHLPCHNFPERCQDGICRVSIRD